MYNSKCSLLLILIFTTFNVFANERLYQAVSDRNLSEVINIVTHDPTVDLNYVHVDKIYDYFFSSTTPLFRAIDLRESEIAEYLINAGANIEKPNQYGYAPLLLAVKFNLTSITKLLINLGVNIEVRERYSGTTPLIRAVQNYNLEITQLLLDKGANTESKDSDDRTAFMHAILGYSGQIGSNVKPGMNAGIDFYLSDQVQYREDTYYHGDLGMLELLLAYKADVNTKDILGNTPLMAVASEFNDNEMAKKFIDILVKSGAKLNEQTVYDKATALMFAAQEGNEEVVQHLINLGANTELLSRNGTALMIISSVDCMWALGRCDKLIKVMKILLKLGANPNQVTSQNITALHIATASGFTKGVFELVKAGANTGIETSQGRTALQIARQLNEYYRNPIVKCLKNKKYCL